MFNLHQSEHQFLYEDKFYKRTVWFGKTTWTQSGYIIQDKAKINELELMFKEYLYAWLSNN